MPLPKYSAALASKELPSSWHSFTWYQLWVSAAPIIWDKDRYLHRTIPVAVKFKYVDIGMRCYLATFILRSATFLDQKCTRQCTSRRCRPVDRVSRSRLARRIRPLRLRRSSEISLRRIKRPLFGLNSKLRPFSAAWRSEIFMREWEEGEIYAIPEINSVRPFNSLKMPMRLNSQFGPLFEVLSSRRSCRLANQKRLMYKME